jgi:hypothetical protein
MSSSSSSFATVRILCAGYECREIITRKKGTFVAGRDDNFHYVHSNHRGITPLVFCGQFGNFLVDCIEVTDITYDEPFKNKNKDIDAVFISPTELDFFCLLEEEHPPVIVLTSTVLQEMRSDVNKTFMYVLKIKAMKSLVMEWMRLMW